MKIFQRGYVSFTHSPSTNAPAPILRALFLKMPPKSSQPAVASRQTRSKAKPIPDSPPPTAPQQLEDNDALGDAQPVKKKHRNKEEMIAFRAEKALKALEKKEKEDAKRLLEEQAQAAAEQKARDEALISEMQLKQLKAMEKVMEAKLRAKTKVLTTRTNLQDTVRQNNGKKEKISATAPAIPTKIKAPPVALKTNTKASTIGIGRNKAPAESARLDDDEYATEREIDLNK